MHQHLLFLRDPQSEPSRFLLGILGVGCHKHGSTVFRSQVREIAQPALVLIVTVGAPFNDALGRQLRNILAGRGEVLGQCRCCDDLDGMSAVAPLRLAFGVAVSAIAISLGIATEPGFSATTNFQSWCRHVGTGRAPPLSEGTEQGEMGHLVARQNLGRHQP